jgi:type IV secretion system protein VirD4
VLDTKGELSAVTARQRRKLGHRVAILDPFGITAKRTDRLNPLDVFALEGSQTESDAEMLASQLSEGHFVKDDPFWSDNACGLISGLIAYIVAGRPSEEHHFNALRSFIYSDDLDYNMAVVLDQKKHGTQLAYDEFVSYLRHASERTRPSVLSTATTFIKALSSEQVARTLVNSTISLQSVLNGDPVDVFITIPPEKQKSHRALTRLWIGTLLTAVMRRKQIPKDRTLFVLDEAAQLGTFEPLLTATTLLRGYGLQVVSVWQDVAQMKSRYPLDWQTILNNSAVLMAFGFGHYAAAKDSAEFLGIPPHKLMELATDQAVLAMRGDGVRAVTRMNYLKEPHFKALADPNPYFKRGPGRVR